jgi:hypothetical protein
MRRREGDSSFQMASLVRREELTIGTLCSWLGAMPLKVDVPGLVSEMEDFAK